jgi:glycosyltransferase involved in cell wall biosynthesis
MREWCSTHISRRLKNESGPLQPCASLVVGYGVDHWEKSCWAQSLGRRVQEVKILVLAYACNPFHGSEEGVGWGWVNAIAQHHEVWVLTAAYHRHDLEEALCREPENRERIHFAYVEEKPWHYRPTPAWIRIENSLIKPIMNWAYRSWLSSAFTLGSLLHGEIHFDLAHQITYVGFRFPGHLWKLHVPFVWGPIGGLENTPWRLLPTMGPRGAVYYGARNVVNSIHRRFLRQPRKAFCAAGPGVIAATGGIRREIRRWYGVDAEVICEVGLPPETVDKCPLRANGEPLRLAWSGRLLPGKALHLLLRALGHMPDTTVWRLDIYGDGPCAVTWQRLAARLGIGSRCTWHGQVSRAEALAGLKSAHLFVTTSLKDLTSTVILEALASGVPVVCPDHCGFADVVNEHCGFKLPIGNVREFETELSRAIVAIARDETMRCRLAEGALRRARDFTWKAKAEAIERVYDRVFRAARERDVAVFNIAMEALAHSSR